nr:YlcI/YnfO family protein [Serratia marcescens]
MESLKDEGESSAGFIVTSMRGEIKRRQRKQARQDKPSDSE